MAKIEGGKGTKRYHCQQHKRIYEMSEDEREQDSLQLAEAVRAACLAAALESYEDASMRGLCHEGAWECAIGAIRALNLPRLLAHQDQRKVKAQT
jgi:hypothetical protein